MATVTTRIDDIDGSDKNVEPVEFSFDGTSFTIDLSADNRAAMAMALKPYIEAGQVSTASNARPKREAGSRVPTREIRAWASENGHEVSNRGAIPKPVIAAYNKANGTSY